MQADKTTRKAADSQSEGAGTANRLDKKNATPSAPAQARKSSSEVFVFTDRIERQFTTAGRDVYSMVNWSRRELKMVDHSKGKVVYEGKDLEFPPVGARTPARSPPASISRSPASTRKPACAR